MTAIVVAFNSAHCFADLGRSLAGLPAIVVDNGSSDASADAAQRCLPGARIVRNAANRGFGAACNQGAALAGTEFVLLVNPDCRFELAAVDELVAQADRFPDAVLFGPQLLDRHGAPEGNYRWRSDGWASRGPLAEGPLCVGFITGAFMLIRRQAMLAIGGFDERFFLYYEDDDLCLRLLDRCGALVLVPAARVQHLSRGSVGGAWATRVRSEYIRGYHHVQSKLMFARRHLRRSPGRFGLLAAALLMVPLRLLLLDPARAARAAGRAAGLLTYRGAADAVPVHNQG